jgi:hypothetical protein
MKEWIIPFVSTNQERRAIADVDVACGIRGHRQGVQKRDCSRWTAIAAAPNIVSRAGECADDAVGIDFADFPRDRIGDIYKLPAASNVRPARELSCAPIAGPPSPDEPGNCLDPAKVVMIPLVSTLRTRLPSLT